MTNIERFFHQEIREMKKAGSGIFSRISTRKGGSNSPLRTPYYFMNNKEKKTLNSKEVVYSMSEVLSFDEFNKLDEDMKKIMLTNWTQKYSRDRIAIHMKIDSSEVTNLITKYKIELPPRGTRFEPMHGSISIPASEIKERIEKGISFDEFLQFDIETQCHILYILNNKLDTFNAISKEYFNIPEIKYLPNLKVRKPYKDLVEAANPKKKKTKKQKQFDNENITNTKSEDKTNNNTKKDILMESNQLIEQIDNNEAKEEKRISKDVKMNVTLSDFKISMSGELDKTSLARRLQFIIGELENSVDDDIFDINIDINVVKTKEIL